MMLSDIFYDCCDYPTVDAVIDGLNMTRAAEIMRREGAIMSAGTGYRYRIYDGELQRKADSSETKDPDGDPEEQREGWHKAAMDPEAFMSHTWATDGHAPMSQTERMTMYRLLIEGYDVIYFINRGTHATLCRSRLEGGELMTWGEIRGDRLDTGEGAADMTIYATGEILAITKDREEMMFKQIDRVRDRSHILSVRRTMRSVRGGMNRAESVL